MSGCAECAAQADAPAAPAAPHTPAAGVGEAHPFPLAAPTNEDHGETLCADQGIMMQIASDTQWLDDIGISAPTQLVGQGEEADTEVRGLQHPVQAEPGPLCDSTLDPQDEKDPKCSIIIAESVPAENSLNLCGADDGSNGSNHSTTTCTAAITIACWGFCDLCT